MNDNVKYKVSVCISVHNTERLLCRCLDSVVAQTLKPIEVILVNNGSTDTSLSIMQEYQERYPEIIKIYSQDDMGLAQGRQTGIDHANGEYITFLDADDYVTTDAYEKMYRSAITHNVDIVECRTIRNGNIIESKYNGKHATSEILKDYFLYGNMPPMIWLRLYRNSLFDTPVLPKLYVNNEDIFAFPCLLYKAKDIFYLKEQLHYYTTDNENSVMNVVKYKVSQEEKIINNRIKTLYVIKYLEGQIGKNIIESEFDKEFKMYTARVILDFCLNTFKSLQPKDCIDIAFQNTCVNMSDVSFCLKHIRHNNKVVQTAVNILGLKKTVSMYRALKNIQIVLKH